MSPCNKKIKRSMSLNDLDDDILLSIASRCTKSSLNTFFNLRMVSKKFNSLCKDHFFLRDLFLEEWSNEFVPNWATPSEIFRGYSRMGLLDAKITEALYRMGLLCYFYDDYRTNEGLQMLEESSEANYVDAIYVYGVILLCKGGEARHKGLSMLSSFNMPMISQTLGKLDDIRHRIRHQLSFSSNEEIGNLQNSYVKGVCNCDGSTHAAIRQFYSWPNLPVNPDIPISSVCMECLWQDEIKLFLWGFLF